MKIYRHLDGDADELLKTPTGEWQYTDPAEHAAAIEMFTFFDLAGFDDWLEAGHLSGHLTEVMAARDELLRRMRTGDQHGAHILALRLQALVTFDLMQQPMREKRAARVASGLRSNRKPADLDDQIKNALATGASNRSVAASLGISERTVRNHRKPTPKK